MPTLPTVTAMMDAVMNELRIPVTNTLERTKIQAQMAYVYGDICAKQDWWWLLKKYVYVLSGDDFIANNPGSTITLTKYSAIATLSSAPSAPTLARRAIWFQSGDRTDQDVYRVGSTYTQGDLTVPLDTIYGGPSASGVAFTAARDEFGFPPQDMAKVLRISRYGSPYDMRKIGIEEMSQLKQRDRSVGPPQYWSIFDHETTGEPSTARIIWVHPYPDASYRLEVWYKHQSAGDLSDLALPIDYQQVLNYGTLSRCYPIFLNDLDRGQYYLGLFNDVMALMANQQREYASDKPGINPSMDLYRMRAVRGRVRRSLGRYFDTLPNEP